MIPNACKVVFLVSTWHVCSPWQAAFKEEAQPPEVLPKPLEVGSLVILQGLKSAPELNEQKGEIDTW